MAAVTTDQNITFIGSADKRRRVKMAAGAVLYRGTLAYITATTGYVDDTDPLATDKFAGMVRQPVTNSGADGTKEAEVSTVGQFVVQHSGLTQADVGKPAYGADNITASVTAADGPIIGQVAAIISATEVAIEFEVTASLP